MIDAAPITLTHPIEVGGVEKSELRVRHALCMGDLAAVQRYARRNGLPSDIGVLLGDGDLGAMLALAEALCQLPTGTLDQLHPEDAPAVLEGIGPFLADGPETGRKKSGR